MRTWLLILAVLIALGAGAYWRLSSEGYVLEFSEDDLKARLQESLPYEKRYLYIFNVTLNNPRFDLVDGSDRIAGGLDVLLNIKLGSKETPVGGAVDLSGALRYDPEARAFFLTNPVVEKLGIEGVPPRYANQANDAISAALGEFYRSRPVYVLEPDTAPKAAAHMLLKDVKIRDERVVVTLGLSRSAARAAAAEEEALE